MESSIFKQAADFLRNKKNARRWLIMFVCLAVVFSLGTYVALKLTGQAKTKQELACSYEVHTHTEDCYSEINGEKQLVCGYADYVVHTHNKDCYDEKGELVCKLPEIKEHKHDDSCYDTVRTLTCGQAETAEHIHTDACYSVNSILTCGQEETPGHTHDASCYDAEGDVICGQEETPGHTHDASCYTEERVLTCGQEETPGHTHSDSCYSEERQLVCGELELHTHTDECYEVQEGVDADNDGEDDKVLICTIPVLEEHTHDESCFKTVGLTAEEEDKNLFFMDISDEDEPEYTCGKEEHIHGDDCYDEEGNLICEKEEHTHDETCMEKEKDEDLAADIVLQAESDDYLLTLKAPASSIPELQGELSLHVRQLEEGSEEYEKAMMVMADRLNVDVENQCIFDITLMDGETEIQPVGPVSVTISPKNADADGEPVNPDMKIYHVNPENNTVDDMGADVSEDGALEMETTHFSMFAVNDDPEPEETEGKEPVVNNTENEPEGETESVEGKGYFIMMPLPPTNESDEDWVEVKETKDLFDRVNNLPAGGTIKLKLVADITVTGSTWNVAYMQIRNKTVILDLNGYTIYYRADTTTLNGADFYLYSVEDGGTLIVKDSASEGKELEETEPGDTGKLYGNQATYTNEDNSWTYYVTKSEINGDKITTTETVEKHTVKNPVTSTGQRKIGAIVADNAKSAGLYSLIRVNKGTFELQGGQLTNMYGHAIRVGNAYGGNTAPTDFTINITGGYIVGNKSNTGTRSDGQDGGGIQVDSTVASNGHINISGGVIAANTATTGGGISVKTSACPVTIGGNAVIAGNSATGNCDNGKFHLGGGIYTESSLEIKDNCYITNNSQLDTKNGEGGGIYCANDLTMTGGYVTGNYALGVAGGIHMAMYHENDGWGTQTGRSVINYNMSGGVIARNYCEKKEGGGLRISYNVAADITGGYITNNRINTSQDWGGGGIFVAQGSGSDYPAGFLRLHNALVTQNTAGGFGGGVGGCSTGDLYVDAKEDGIAIYGNSAAGTNLAGEGSTKHEDRNAYENQAFMDGGYQDFFCAMRSSVSRTMLGGGSANWNGTADYEDVNKSGEDPIIAGSMMGLTAGPNGDGIGSAIAQASVFISGNSSSTHGGGIMCNGILVTGDNKNIKYPAALNISFNKSLTGGSGDDGLKQGEFKFALLSRTKVKELVSNLKPGDCDYDGDLYVPKAPGDGWSVYKSTGDAIITAEFYYEPSTGSVWYKNGSASDVNVTDALVSAVVTNDAEGNVHVIASSLDRTGYEKGSAEYMNDWSDIPYDYYLVELREEGNDLITYDPSIYTIRVNVKDSKETAADDSTEITYEYVDSIRIRKYNLDKATADKYDSEELKLGNYSQANSSGASGTDVHKPNGDMYVSFENLGVPTGHNTEHAASLTIGKAGNSAFTNKTDETVSFSLRKMIGDTETPLRGVEFKLTKLNNENTKVEGTEKTAATGTDGYVSFRVKKEAAKYQLEEMNLPANYKKAGPWTVAVDNDGNVTITDEASGEKLDLKEVTETVDGTTTKFQYYRVDNWPDDVEFEFTKKDAVTKDPIEDVVFTMKDMTDSTVKQMKETSDGNGKIVFKELKCGHEYLLEEQIPSGYQNAGPWFIVVDSKGEITCYKAENDDGGNWKRGIPVTLKSPGSDENIIDNTPEAYELPESGGPGTTIYTMSGLLLMAAFGALMYNKKIRERRSRSSRI